MCHNHISSAWYRGAQQDDIHFTSTFRDPNKDIICQIVNSVKRTIEENRKKNSIQLFIQFYFVKQMIWNFVGKIAPKETSSNFICIELREETVF